ncbi:ATP synthase subunit I [Dehalobacterium formicoaceticum]|uniref:Uncharacterized protein n=1 Tax=Dehalobacterium formicoaceticum TaxID=51515 RepID=A0ABT1Y3I2_9FIRM|nr:ATP synthase subunit I [Dehalobacterium formicoaceticum]MCR6545430.1 hypothetical protein [Dehalobacterium formicoaceticum]
MWQEILISLLVGLVFGSLIGALNHWLVWSALKKAGDVPSPAAKNKLMGRYLIRFMLDFLAMATFFIHKDLYVLVGTAVGLTLIGKVLAVKYSFVKKEVK